MRLNITSKGHHLSESLREHVESKIGKLEKYIHGESEVHIVLERNHLGQIAEIVLHANHHRLHSRETADNVLQCIDKAVSKIETQLRKLKDKMTDWRSKEKEPFDEEV